MMDEGEMPCVGRKDEMWQVMGILASAVIQHSPV